MPATVVAVFPLALVRDSISYHGEGRDPVLWDRFGYDRARRMRPSVVYSTPNLSRVYCGDHPLVAWVGWRSHGRFNAGRSCYINAVGEHCYPA